MAKTKTRKHKAQARLAKQPIVIPPLLANLQQRAIVQKAIDKRWLEATEIEEKVLTNFSLVVLMALRDEFGFGTSRAMRIAKKILEIDESIALGYLTFEDIKETLRDELGQAFYEYYLEPNWLSAKKGQRHE